MPLVCRLGFHEWTLVYLFPGFCEAQEFCTQCGAKRGDVKTAHRFEWANAESPCVRECVCKRCGTKQGPAKTEHQFEWVYAGAQSCVREQVCGRCGVKQGSSKVEHECSWDYAEANSFVRKSVCKRCGSVISVDEKGQESWSTISRDSTAKAHFLSMQEAMAALRQCERVWYITSEESTWDIKRHARVGSLITRVPAVVMKATLPYTNIELFGLSFAGKRLFFFPNGAVIVDAMGTRLSAKQQPAMGYADAQVVDKVSRFAETDEVPRDTKVTGHTWQYKCFDAGPDLDSQNAKVPIVEYGVAGLLAADGTRLQLYVSNPACAHRLAEALGNYIDWLALRAAAAARQAEEDEKKAREKAHQEHRDSGHEGAHEERHDAGSELGGKSAHEVLGVSEDAPLDEIKAAYRKLAMETHPDRVAGLDVEFRELAGSRMRVINAAYEELVRKRR